MLGAPAGSCHIIKHSMGMQRHGRGNQAPFGYASQLSIRHRTAVAERECMASTQNAQDVHQQDKRQTGNFARDFVNGQCHRGHGLQ